MTLRIEFTKNTIQLNTYITAPDGTHHWRDFLNLDEATTQVRDHYQRLGYRLAPYEVQHTTTPYGQRAVIAEADILS